MRAMNLHILVEEPSAEAFLQSYLRRVLPAECIPQIHAFGGKRDLLSKLEQRLKSLARSLGTTDRVLVLVDRDDDDCAALKSRLEAKAEGAGLVSRTRAGNANWQVVNRVLVEELEAWYFGDWDAVRAAYPRVPAGVVGKRGFRDPDAVAGGTWEALERILQRHRYFETGLRKVELAREMGRHLQADRNTSESFKKFHEALLEALA